MQLSIKIKLTLNVTCNGKVMRVDLDEDAFIYNENNLKANFQK